MDTHADARPPADPVEALAAHLVAEGHCDARTVDRARRVASESGGPAGQGADPARPGHRARPGRGLRGAARARGRPRHRRPPPSRSAPPRRSGQCRRPSRCAACARTGASWCRASRPATRRHRRALGPCCPPAGAGARHLCAAVAPPAPLHACSAWSGPAQPGRGPSRPTMEPIRPSVWHRARRNTALSVSAVRIARGEYQGWPPGVVRGSARQPSMASFVNQTVRLPRWRRLASYSRQFMILCFCLETWWRRCWFSLNRKRGIQLSGQGGASYAEPVPDAAGRSMQQGLLRPWQQLLHLRRHVRQDLVRRRLLLDDAGQVVHDGGCDPDAVAAGGRRTRAASGGSVPLPGGNSGFSR